MNYTHDDIFNMLVLGDFPRNYARSIYVPIKQKNTIYVEAMDRVREPNNDPSIEKLYFEHDAILSFFPERARDSSCNISNVSVEIKTNRDDLLNDQKMLQYIGPANAFFLAVPEPLLKDAIKKIRSFKSQAPLVGLIEALSGDIVIMPRQEEDCLDIGRRNELLSHIYLMKKRVETPKPEHRIMAVRLGLDRPQFELCKGLFVNRNYISFVRQWA